MDELPVFHEFFERSKNDHAMIVGSEVREVIWELRKSLVQIADLTAQLEERTRQRDEWLARANKDIAERMDHEKHLLAEQERIGVIGSWPEGATQVVLVNKKADKYLEELSMTCLRLESMYNLVKKTDADLDAERNLTAVMNKENLALVAKLAELKQGED